MRRACVGDCFRTRITRRVTIMIRVRAIIRVVVRAKLMINILVRRKDAFTLQNVSNTPR